MRGSIMVAAFLLLLTDCGEETAPPGPPPPAAPGSRSGGETCGGPEDCAEGLWCLDGRCVRPLQEGQERREEIERVQEERYQQMDERMKSIEGQLQ
ncbi:MAG: hypothetical protein FJ098_04640 [Deltaproteobacteria bacterium]|nr:hypothetical protein [Deltaproteobacteria bacterium]